MCGRAASLASESKRPRRVNAKEVLAASSTRKASAASDADVVEKNQIGGEKPVLMIGSPMCCITVIKSQNAVERRVRRTGGQGVIMTMMRNANRVSEVKYKNFVEQCVRHLEEQEMCKCWETLEDCSCIRFCGTGGLVDSASP